MGVFTIFVLTVIVSTNSFAKPNSVQETECKLKILNMQKTPRSFILYGSVKEKTGLDYLTLEPNTLSGAKYSARILLTGDYDPVTIHPRGNTVNTVARGDLAVTDEVHLEYYDRENETQYVLDCKNS